MAFLDNSGDIILDAVLTDTGRKRLARGDGTFRISRFALSDEEIDYGTYDALSAQGPNTADLQIMQTPILEAFTNNQSGMHSFLQTYTNNSSLLYLPVLKLNTLKPGTNINSQFNSFLVAVNQNTACALSDQASPAGGGWTATEDGIWYGFNTSLINTYCRIDQGIDNAQVPPGSGWGNWEMYENQYMVEMDSRLGRIAAPQGTPIAKHSFVDDDGIAVYYFSTTVNPNFVTKNTVNTTVSNNLQVIAGVRGSIFGFQVYASDNLRNNTGLFTMLGGEFNAADTDAGETVNCYYIDSIIRVTGMTTGYSIDIPVRYVQAVDAYTCAGTAP